MSTVVVTAAEVYAGKDIERAVAAVSRVGGGVYVVATQTDKTEYPTYDEAVAAASKFADDIDASAAAGANAPDDVKAYIAALQAEIAELKAKLAGGAISVAEVKQ